MTALVSALPRSAAATGRRRRVVRRRVAVGALVAVVFVLTAVTLMVGETVYGPDEVLRVVLGQTVPGASFTVGDLRLPRAVAGLLAGGAFGLGGVTFQTMLRNPLASPDIIGISWGASAAAVTGIVLLHLDPATIAPLAVAAALLTSLGISFLAYRRGIAGTRFILIGIGVAAMLHSVVAYVLARAASWDLQTAMRWLTGSLNGVGWAQIAPLAAAVAVGLPLLLTQGRALELLQHGDDTAAALGVRVQRTRVVVIVAAVGLIAVATSAVGPVAFVAFLAGPIAARIVGPGRPLLVPAALTGALLVQGADLIGQFALDTRYPVGVVTGVLGAPYLLLLLVRANRAGAAL